MTATPGPPWSDPDPARPVPFWEALRGDARAVRPAAGRGAIVRACWESGFRVGLRYRLAHGLRPRGFGLGWVAAGLLTRWNRHVHGCTIAPTARIFGGLVLPHPIGVVIGPGSVIGPGAWIFQHVTIGGAPGKVGAPRLGAFARLYAGAVVAGPVALGDHVAVGANAVVTRDVPARTLVRSPAAELVPIPGRLLDPSP